MISKNDLDSHNHKFVITGGPGAGKTALIQALSQAGFAVVAEDARRIIQQQVDTKGNGLPWKDKTHYANLMLQASIDTYQKATAHRSDQLMFFDRGIIDTLCYMDMEKIPLPYNLDEIISAYKYNTKVFILPAWKEIYLKDSERKQSWQEAEFTFHQMKQTYLKYGYQLIQLPKLSIEARVKCVLDHI